MNIRSINSVLTSLFQRYSIALNKINGNELFGKTQTRQIQDADGVSIPYAKGRIVFKNDIDPLEFLIQNRAAVADALGITSTEIYDNRRFLQKVNEYLAKLGSAYDLGKKESTMQMYISKYDDNIGSLDSQQDWVDYILTQGWIDKLANRTIEYETEQTEEQLLADHRIEYLSNILQGMVKDHEIDFHKTLDDFNPNDYLDSGKENLYNDAYNKLMSFNALEYGFYEIYKPIGNSDEKYIKIKMSTNGELDITGVVALTDCEHIPWEYGTLEYLRAKNTGNQRYHLKLSLPLNDENSILYWKPDEKEQLEIDDEEEEGEVTQPTGYRYYKPYETERFLRWFGTNFIPMLDLDTISKKTVCSSPNLKNDTESSNFHTDVTNITQNDLDMTRASITSSTSQSLLSLVPKATLDIVNKIDPPGQYLEFIVSGNRQTSNVTFRVTGKLLNVIQEMNHYKYTWDFLQTMYTLMSKEILFYMMTVNMNPQIVDIWDELYPNEKWIPDNWVEILSKLEYLQNPNVVDLLRFRQMDYEMLSFKIVEQETTRRMFLMELTPDEYKHDYSEDEDDDAGDEEISPAEQMEIDKDKMRKYLEKFIKDQRKIDKIIEKASISVFYNINLDKYIQTFNTEEEGKKWFRRIPMADETKEELITIPLKNICRIGLSKKEQDKIDEERKKYEINFDDVTVEELRNRIETFNNLIVRLPVNTYHNRLASRHIFLDWKSFVDGAVQKMVENGDEYESPDTSEERKAELESKRLYVWRETNGEWRKVKGIGTEHKRQGGSNQMTNKEHEYVELYTDSGRHYPLVDYSYLYDTTTPDGAMNPYINPETDMPYGDRWDYWSVEDFQ